MKPFNLAESKIAERRYCKNYVNRRLRLIALLVIITVVVATVCYGCRISVQSKATKLKLELADVQSRCMRIKEDIAEVKAKSSKRKWQSQLVQGSTRWLGVIDSIFGRVPSDIWLNRIENNEQNSNILIEGQAQSFSSLSTFMDALRSSPKFLEIRLNNTRTMDKEGIACVDFSLQLKLKDGGSSTNPNPTQAPVQTGAVPPVQESQ